MKYNEFKKMCRQAWSENFNNLYFDMGKNKKGGKNRIFSESKTHILNAFPKAKFF